METMGVFFSFKYKLSLNLIDLIIPFVIQYDFLCFCLSNVIVFYRYVLIYCTSKIPVRWPGQCYGFTLSLIFKYCGSIGLY